MQTLLQPWPWFIAGPAIGLIMLSLLYLGKTFGVSANLRTLCTLGGAGRFSDFFRFDWKSQAWNLLFVGGVLLGGVLMGLLGTTDRPIELSAATQARLLEYGISTTDGILPEKLFGIGTLASLKGWIFLVLGGFLVGFGTRWAGGCTSGHAIMGLSDLQKGSLIAVLGFFAGGLVMTHLLLPWILTL